MKKIPYGDQFIDLDLSEEVCDVIKPPSPLMETTNLPQLLEDCFNHPLDNSFIDCDFSGKSISIAVNDQTRLLPYEEILEPFLNHLLSCNAEKDRISFFIATGTHQPLTQIEIARLLPEKILSSYPVICHDCDEVVNLLYLGQTTAGTPVFANRNYYQADIRVVIGNIEPHHFMGYSGGVKTAAIGLGGRETITKNHAMLSHPNSKMGLFYRNPMRQDVEEIGRLMGIHYAFNIVMDSEKRVVSAFWGDPKAVIRAGIKFYQDFFQMDLEKHLSQYDVVIASPGGYPKDINLYQAQKALTHACLFAKKDAVIILVAECRDGYGSTIFEEFLTAHRTAEQIIKAFEEMAFRIGAHKAYQLALQAQHHHIKLVSEIKDSQPICELLKSYYDLDSALDSTFLDMPNNIKIALLPDATHVIPRIIEA